MIIITIKTTIFMTDSMKKCIRNRPIIGYFLYKYLGIEINSYKEWWKEYSFQTQVELESQPKNLRYTSLLS